MTEHASRLSDPFARRPPVTGAELVWQLVDVTAECLEPTDRCLVFADIGSENYLFAIGRLLTRAADSSLPLRLSLLFRVNDWLDGYKDTPEEPKLRRLIERVKRSAIRDLPRRRMHG